MTYSENAIILTTYNNKLRLQIKPTPSAATDRVAIKINLITTRKEDFMKEALSQSEIALRNDIIRIIKAEVVKPGELTYAINNIFDKRYDHRRDMEHQLIEAEARVNLIKSRIAMEERFGCEFQSDDTSSR